MEQKYANADDECEEFEVKKGKRVKKDKGLKTTPPQKRSKKN